jgi:leader peptidase (prepilin peptidase) / N-methyltransferase
VLIGLLAAISYVDIQEMRIPDPLSAALLLGGGISCVALSNLSLIYQIISGVSVGIGMALVRFGHTRLTGRVGLGLGDVKMAGAGAVWINPLLLPLFIFAASALGLIYALLRPKQRNERIQFAPFLSLSLVMCWVVEHFV